MESISHLLVSDRDESEFGQFSQHVEVRPHVQLAAHQNHLGIGTELLGLSLPLCGNTEDRQNQSESVRQAHQDRYQSM